LVEVDSAQARDLADQPATMAGVTWPDGQDAPEVHVRGLDLDGGWTLWLLLETAEDPASGEPVAGTEPGWIGAVTALQIRAELDGADVTEQLVAHVVTTSPTGADEQVGALPAAPSTDTADARSEAGRPPAPQTRTSAADQLRSVVIHHTAGTNSYSSSESAQLVRGIQRYHTATLGWADIGYNVLVSKYGQVFEGRGGGLHRNIAGAHAVGFNTGSFGISVMGDHSSTAPPRAAMVALAHLVGWKLLSTFQTNVKGTSSWPTAEGTKHSQGD